MEDTIAHRAAVLLTDARRTRKPLDNLPNDLRPKTLSQSYAIQKALNSMLGEPSGVERVGYKVGATNRTAQEGFGLESPFRGELFSTYIHHHPATLSPDLFFFRIVESEFAFLMGEDLPPVAGPYDREGVMDAIETMFISIEVVDLRYAIGPKAGGLQIIADGGGTGCWIQGAKVDHWRTLDLENHEVKLIINDDMIIEGNSANVMGNPINSLTWLANDLSLSGGGLVAGDIVSTGSSTMPTPVGSGDTAVANFGELGQVVVCFKN